METMNLPMEESPDENVWINGRCWYRDQEDLRTVFGYGLPWLHYDTRDREAKKFVCVSLVEDNLATQEEVSVAFGCGVASIRRWQRLYEQKGLAGLFRKKRKSPLLKMGGAKDAAVRRMFERGYNNVEMAQRLGVSEATVRDTLKRLGLKRKREQQQSLELQEVETAVEESALPTEEAPKDCETQEQKSVAEEPQADVQTGEIDSSQDETIAEGFTTDLDPLNRNGDRMLACVGLLDDAQPLFASGNNVAGAGVLLAAPLIAQSGILKVFERIYRSLAPAFYGLRTTVMALFFMALVRVKRPEQLKERAPVAMGRALGLDRVLEVKTLRRKLGVMAKRQKGAELMRQLARNRLKGREDLVGFLYVDGHVREYHGKANLAKGYVTCRRLAAKAATDTWVNDAKGDPVFLITSELNEGLTQMLEPVLDEVEQFVGTDSKVTVVFDRGGWSPKPFARLIERGFDLLTYRKGKSELLPVDSFQKMTAIVDGKTVSYMLHDMSVCLGKRLIHLENGTLGPLWMRQVTRLSKDETHQTQVMTTRQDLSSVEVLWRMFNRWRQENFFKYMRHEYAIDGLVDYRMEHVSEELDRPNPEYRKIEKQIRQAQASLKKVEAEYGAEADQNVESKRPTMRGFKIANSKIGKKLRAARSKVEKLKERLSDLPKRIPASDLERLSGDRKMITDAVKMSAYQIETDLVRMAAPYYPRSEDEGRKLITAALGSCADINVTGGELHVSLSPQSSPHRSRAIAALCEDLNAMDQCFPGTSLRLRFSVSEPA